MARTLPTATLLILLLAAACDTPGREPPEDTREEVSGPPGKWDVPEVQPDTLPPLPVGLDGEIPEGQVRAGFAKSDAFLLTGPKAEGQLHDLVMKNSRAAFVIESHGPAGGYRMWGGNLVDAALIKDGVARPDRLGELWFGWNLLVFRPRASEVVKDGTDGEAVVRITGRTDNYPWPDSFIRPLLNPGPADLAITHEYRLRPDETRLELTVTLVNDGTDRVSMDQPFVIMNLGDGVKSYAPDRGFAGVSGAGALPWFGGVGLEMSYAFELGGDLTATGLFSYANVDLMTLPSFALAPGESKTLTFNWLLSDNGTADFALTRTPQPLSISGRVEGLAPLGPAREDAEAEPAWVVARGLDQRVLGIAPIQPDNTYRLSVPDEPVLVEAWAYGQGGSGPQTVTPPLTDLTLTLPAPATLEVTVRDHDDQLIPAQLTVWREPGTASPFAPDDVRIGPDPGSNRSALAYIIEPATPVRLPPGRYRAVASRGYSYELDEATLDLEPGEVLPLELTLTRAVDTTGWLAADMHLHGRWSSDSDVPYHARVRQAAANDVALPMLTEHAYVGDLMSAAMEAGVDEWVTPIPAQEVTTFEYGHFNAFPLVYDPDLPSGGAVFEHGRPGTELFSAMRAQQPEPVVIQVNHPRSQLPFFAYFDYIGLDSATGEARNPARFTTNWDLIEVFNGRCVGSANNDEALLDWIRLTNLGWKKTLSSGSDSHSEGGGLGHPRGWIALEQAALELDPQAIVEPLLNRQTFVSCGPFVRFSAADGAGMGELTTVDEDGEVAFAVEVWAPTWIGVTEVRLWENGVPVQTEAFADAYRGPDATTPARRFDGVMRHTPSADAWYAIEVVGTGSLAPVELGDTPYALTNPIEVDQDGDGVWTPPGND